LLASQPVNNFGATKQAIKKCLVHRLWQRQPQKKQQKRQPTAKQVHGKMGEKKVEAQN